MAAALDDLAQLMESYPKVAKYAHVVLVPSLEDHAVTGGGTSGLLFPQPPIRGSLSPRLQQVCSRLSLTTNPGRITTRTGQQVVLFNHAGLSPQYFIPHQQQQQQHHAGSTSVWLPSSSSSKRTYNDDGSMNDDDDDTDTSMKKSTVQEQQQRVLCRTMLEQGHLLAPLLSSSWSSSSHPPAVYWNLDHALRLDGPPTPGGTPTCIVLGLQSHDSPFVQQVGDCQILCPGSLVPPMTMDDTLSSSNIKRKGSKRGGGGADAIDDNDMDIDDDQVKGSSSSDSDSTGWYSTIRLPSKGSRMVSTAASSSGNGRGNKKMNPVVDFHKLYDLGDDDDEDDDKEEGDVMRQ